MPTPEHSISNVGWTVGTYCNATCGHCYSWKSRREHGAFLTHANVDRIVDQLALARVRTVNLGGNEPIFTHGPDLDRTLLPYIIRTLNHAGITVGLTTNGVSFLHLEAAYPDTLSMLNDIDFSLDFPFEEEHDLHRSARLFRGVMAGIQRAHDLGIATCIVTCGMRANFNREYLNAFLLLTQSLGSEFRINVLKPVEKDLLGAMPSSQEFYEGFSFLMEHTRCITLGESCITALTGMGHKGCPCGTSSFRIAGKTTDSRVPITPCVYLPEFNTGDLLVDDLGTILTGASFQRFRNRRRSFPKVCRDVECPYLDACGGGCAARAFLVSGDIEARDPYCPLDFKALRGSFPMFPPDLRMDRHRPVRVHDNYLCTWIGQVLPEYKSVSAPTREPAYPGDRGSRPIRHSSAREQADAPAPSQLNLRLRNDDEGGNR